MLKFKAMETNKGEFIDEINEGEDNDIISSKEITSAMNNNCK